MGLNIRPLFCSGRTFRRRFALSFRQLLASRQSHTVIIEKGAGMKLTKRTTGNQQLELAAASQSKESFAPIKRHVRGRMENNQPNQVDVYIGKRIRLRRIMLGLSQEFFAKQLGVTFQQVQKYETGRNRVGGSRLFDITRILNVRLK